MRELDLLLLRWLDAHYETADDGVRSEFEALLELPDPQLAAWLLHGEPPTQSPKLIEALRQGPPSAGAPLTNIM